MPDLDPAVALRARTFVIRVAPFVAGLTILAAPATPAQNGAARARVSDSLATRIDAIFADVDRTASPGCALGVVRDGALVYARGYGMANLDDGVPLGPTSAFYIASTSKQFAATSILLLAERGKLSLDDDVRRWVPELPDYGRRITIGNLLHHTSGIRDYLGLLLGLGAGHVENLMTDEQILALIARQKSLNFTPGSEYSYSNSGYFLLGIIVKRVSGMSLRQFADANIFAPLGMRHSHFHDDRLMTIPHRVIGYDPDPTAPGHFTIDFYANFTGVGDGGLWTTVDDLALWDQNFYDHRVGGDALARDQLIPGRLNNGDTLTYASGLMLGTHRGLPTVAHGGAFMGYRTELLRYPTQHLSVICLCNLATANPSDRAQRVADLFLANAYHTTVASAGVAPQATAVIDPSSLRALAGSYRSDSAGSVIELSVRGSTPVIGLFGTHIALRSISATELRDSAGPVPVAVRLLPAGQREGGRINLSIADGRAESYTRYEPQKLTGSRLASYAGRYTSDEIGASYVFTVAGDTLFVEIPGYPRGALSPTIADAFVSPGMSFRFVRDAAMRVASVVVYTAQARNIHFERQSPRPATSK